MTDNFFLGSNVDEFYKNIKKEFGKSRADVDDYVKDLRNWALTQKHFPETPSINACVYFIATCKFSIEKAKTRIDMYYTIRNLMPETFNSHPLSPEMVQQNRFMYLVPLPKVTAKNERIVYIKENPESDPEDFSHELILVQYVHLMELLIQEDKSNNLHTIVDFDGFKPSQIPRVRPVVIKKFLLYIEKVTSTRMASVYLVNLYPLVETVVNTIVIPFMSEKLKTRVHMDGGTSSLFERFGKTHLPSDIGGEGPSLEETRDLLMKQYEAMKERFDRIQPMTCNESLRENKLKNDDILGYYGSFRQINVD